MKVSLFIMSGGGGGGEYVLTILSNLLFIIPMIEAFRRHRFTRAMLFLGVLVFSSMYHTCNSFYGACVFNANFHRQLDYFFAQFTIPATALYIIIFPESIQFLERILLIIFAVMVVILQSQMGEVMLGQLILVASAFGFILIYWFIYAIYQWAIKEKGPYFPNYDWDEFVWGIALTGVASSLFVIEAQGHNLRWATHSVWHALGAMGQFFILRIREPAPRYANMDALIREHVVGKWAHEHLLVHHTPISRV